MEFLLYGYGNGSKDDDGTAKQYKTLRGSVDTDRIHLQRDGVLKGSTSMPCIKMPGHTQKVSQESRDNEVELLVHGMTQDEALEMSCRFAEFALMLRNEEEEKPSFGSDYATQAADQFLQVLLASDRDAGMAFFLRELKEYWTKDAETKGNLVPFLVQHGHTENADFYKRTAGWRQRCADLLGELLAVYVQGPKVEAPEGPVNTPKLQVVVSNPDSII